MRLRRGYKQNEIYIISGNQATIRALDGPKYQSRLIYGCHKNLNRVAHENKLVIIWAPHNLRSKGYMEAKCLTRVAARGAFVGPEPAIVNSAPVSSKRP